MSDYLSIFLAQYKSYGNYLLQEITSPGWGNYFYALIAVSFAVWILELIWPWRKNQGKFRKDFWLDGFYMFFNFFLFALIMHRGLSEVGVAMFNDFLGLFGITNAVAISVASWPNWAQFVLLFLVADFVQWNVHRVLHHVPWMWEFHKVHHSIKEMGFAGHLRFHWMENIFYKTALFIPLTMIGFGIDKLFVYHMLTVLIGHLNHANVGWDYGPLKYILNNPKMHIWHHLKEMPEEHPYGMNYGISLSLWDYIFKTDYVPSSGRDIELGFNNDEDFPEDFLQQIIYPLNKKK